MALRSQFVFLGFLGVSEPVANNHERRPEGRVLEPGISQHELLRLLQSLRFGQIRMVFELSVETGHDLLRSVVVNGPQRGQSGAGSRLYGRACQSQGGAIIARRSLAG